MQELARLLEALALEPKRHATRLEAARTALVLCFQVGDPHLADVAESLLADAPLLTPRATRAELDRLAAQAIATRRAVSLAHGHSHGAPAALGRALSRDPEQLADEVERRLRDDQPALARAVLEVGLTRHRAHPRLVELQRHIQDRWPAGARRASTGTEE